MASLLFDNHEPGDTYKWLSPSFAAIVSDLPNKRITALPDGSPILEHVNYVIARRLLGSEDAYPFAFRLEGDAIITPDTGADVRNPTPSLGETAKVGSITGRVLTVGGIKSEVWKETTTAEYGFVLGADGEQYVQKLPTITAPVDTPTTYEVLGVYELVPILTPPNAPTALTATQINVNNYTIHLAATDNSNNESGFEWAAADAQAGPYTPLITTDAGVVTLDLSENRYGVLLWFRVVALNAAGRSDAATTSITLVRTVRVLTATFYLAQNGTAASPEPISPQSITGGQTYLRRAAGQHIGVRITDAGGNVPTDAYSGLQLSVYDAFTGLTTGITAPDQTIKPSAGIVWAYPRPYGPVLNATAYTLTAIVVQGVAEVQRWVMNFLLDNYVPPGTNQLPNAVAVADIAITTGVAYSVTMPVITDPDPGDVIDPYLIQPLPAGWAFSSATRVFSITAGANTALYSGYLNYIGLDTSGGQRPNQFLMTITARPAANQAPVAPSPLPTLTFQFGLEGYRSLPRFTDPDVGDFVTHTVTGLPSWLDFYPSGSIHDGVSPWLAVKTGGVPATATGGTLTYTGTDNHGLATSVSLSYTVIMPN